MGVNKVSRFKVVKLKGLGSLRSSGGGSGILVSRFRDSGHLASRFSKLEGCRA